MTTAAVMYTHIGVDASANFNPRYNFHLSIRGVCGVAAVRQLTMMNHLIIEALAVRNLPFLAGYHLSNGHGLFKVRVKSIRE